MADQLLSETTRLRRSPLAHLGEQLSAASVTGARGVALRENPFLTMVGIRVAPGTAAAEAVAAAAGVGLPAGHGRTTGGPEGRAVVRIGPDEFLLVGPRVDAAPSIAAGLSTDPLVAELIGALGEAPGAVVDLSANRTTLELDGPSARAVLEKGCHLDLHPRAFEIGTAVSTALGPVPVLLWRTGPLGWRIMPRASFAEYTAHWLIDAMREFASPEVA